MHIDKFMPLLLDKASIRSSPHDMDYFTWNLHKRYAELTELIDYGCDFTEDSGCCKQYRVGDFHSRGNKEGRVKSCCIGCAINVGYFSIVPNDWELIRALARKFSTVNGFWRRGTGCALPRKLRSVTCLGYNCYAKVPDFENYTHRVKSIDTRLIFFFRNFGSFVYKDFMCNKKLNGLYLRRDIKTRFLQPPKELEIILKKRRKK